MTAPPSSPPPSRSREPSGRADTSSGHGAASALEHLRELEASKARVVPLEADDWAQPVLPPAGAGPQA